MNKQMKRKYSFVKLVVLIVASFTIIHFIFAFLPYKEMDFFLSRNYSTRIFDNKKNLLQVLSLKNGLRREFLPLENINDNVKEKFINAEDKRFYFHFGIDLISVVRAIIQNCKEEKIVSGASTISMQLAKMIKMNYLNDVQFYKVSKPRSIMDKIDELFYALKLEARFSKAQILELYLNNIPFGNNVEGINSASRIYFNKNVNELSNDELELLVKVPRNPKLYAPRKIYSHPFYVPHFVEYLKKENHLEKNNFYQTKTFKSKWPYEVCLSLDKEIQDFSKKCALNAIELAKENRISNISVFVMDVKNAKVLAWVGSKNFLDEKSLGQNDGVINRIQPGSSVKPFLYGTALEDKIITPSDILPDIPMFFDNYYPLNFNNRFNGPVRVRVALGSSLNVPAVYLLNKIGIESYVEKLKILGFSNIEKSSQDAGLSMALGSVEMSLCDLTNAFSVFAREGKYIPLNFFEDEYAKKSASFYKNTTIVKQKKESENYRTGNCIQAFSKDVSGIICSFLSQSNARSVGFGQNEIFKTKYPSIFKTGTSNQFQNITALAATPRYAVGVWMGNFSGETVVAATGSSLPASVARIILDYLEEKDGLESMEFSKPENYSMLKICALSGMKPSKKCLNIVYEYVHNDLIKTRDKCDWHVNKDGQIKTYYPEIFQRWLLLEGKEILVQPGKMNQKLQILFPQNDSVFYTGKNIHNQSLVLEVIGGTENQIDIFIDDKFYKRVERPFLVELPLEKGKHFCKVICSNQENVVSYEVR